MNNVKTQGIDMINSKILLDDLLKWGVEHTGNEPSISCFYRAFDEIKSYVERLESRLAEIKKQEPVGEFNGVFGFSGRSYFEVTCFDSLPTVGAKLYTSPVHQHQQACAECGAGADDEGLCLYCVKCMFSVQQSPEVKLYDFSNDLNYLYWSAYHAGHHDTVESIYDDVLHQDRLYYWEDRVKECLESGDMQNILGFISTNTQSTKE